MLQTVLSVFKVPLRHTLKHLKRICSCVNNHHANDKSCIHFPYGTLQRTFLFINPLLALFLLLKGVESNTKSVNLNILCHSESAFYHIIFMYITRHHPVRRL